MVAEILADAAKLVLHGHAEVAEQLRRANAGYLQQPRRVGGAGT